MIVCQCRVVSDRVIAAEVAAGATQIEDLARRCGAGSDCGGCHRRLTRLLTVAGRPVTTAA